MPKKKRLIDQIKARPPAAGKRHWIERVKAIAPDFASELIELCEDYSNKGVSFTRFENFPHFLAFVSELCVEHECPVPTASGLNQVLTKLRNG